MRVLLKLRKGDEIRYLSHLDMVRAFEFALRRSRVPLAFTEGFNPRPKMAFGPAIGVGVTSDDDWTMLDLACQLDPSEIKAMLNSQLPPGMEVSVVEEVPEGVKSPISTLNAAQYRLTFECSVECDSSAVEGTLRAIFAAPEVKVVRDRQGKKKEVDIRPHLLVLGAVELQENLVIVDVSLGRNDSGGARPQDLAQALGEKVPGVDLRRVHRLRQFHFNAES